MSDEISFDDFPRVDMRVGRIVAVEEFPEAEPDVGSQPGDRIG